MAASKLKPNFVVVVCQWTAEHVKLGFLGLCGMPLAFFGYLAAHQSRIERARSNKKRCFWAIDGTQVCLCGPPSCHGPPPCIFTKTCLKVARVECNLPVGIPAALKIKKSAARLTGKDSQD